MGFHAGHHPKRFVAGFLVFLIIVPVFVRAQMKLLAPNTGWLIDVNRLLWTSDNGAHWTNITPHVDSLPKGALFTHVFFFRGTSEAWAILSYKEPVEVHTLQDMRAFENAKPIYALAHTEDSGKNWTAIPISFPSLPKWIEDTFAGPIGIDFQDSNHGWMQVSFMGMSKQCRLLATDDGGRTWKWVDSAPFSGPFAFTSRDDGWQFSEWDNELYATHDGARTWNKVQLPQPPGIGTNVRPIPEMPQFQSESKGYLVVTFVGAFSVPPVIVVYSTDSGGKDWHLFKTITVSRDTAFALVDSTSIFVTPSEPEALTTQQVSLTDRSPLKLAPSLRGVSELSFVDKRTGWAKTLNAVCATSDGGITWKKITPPPLYIPRVVGSAPEKKTQHLCH
ncbi:MAG TPA: hypothetical protein VF126_02970 [Acidobacteriaceae bacterium]